MPQNNNTNPTAIKGRNQPPGVESSLSIPRVESEIRNALIMEEDSLPSDNSRFLASLLGQGAGMFGAALQGNDITKVGQVFESNRDIQNKLNEQNKIRQESITQAKNLMNPASEESKRKRLIYEKSLGIKIPPEFSASDLEDRNVLQGLIAQSQPKPVLSRGGGVAQPKEAKEKPSEKKLLDEYSKHAEALQSSIDTIEAVNKLNRTRIGRFTPDFSTSTQAESGTMDRAAAGLIKVLAGPGTVSDSDAARLGGLVPNSNMSRDLAAETTKRQTLEGTQKALASLRIERELGRINETDFKKIINQYNKYLTNPKLGLNKEINQDGDIVDIAENDISPSEQEQAIKWANENINSKDESTRLKAERILRGR